MTKSVRKRFHELSLGRTNRLGLGTSKIEVLANNSEKKHGKSVIFPVFPACGVGCLTSSLGKLPPGLGVAGWYGWLAVWLEKPMESLVLA